MIHSNGVRISHGLRNPRYFRLFGEEDSWVLRQVSARDLPEGRVYDAVLSAEGGRIIAIAVEMVDGSGRHIGFAVEEGVKNDELLAQIVSDYGFAGSSSVVIDRN